MLLTTPTFGESAAHPTVTTTRKNITAGVCIPYCAGCRNSALSVSLSYERPILHCVLCRYPLSISAQYGQDCTADRRLHQPNEGPTVASDTRLGLVKPGQLPFIQSAAIDNCTLCNNLILQKSRFNLKSV